ADDIYDRPATTFVATLVGAPRINLLPARREDGMVQITDSHLHIPAPHGGQLPAELQVGIRPEDVRPAEGGAFTGEVALTEPLGVETIVHIRSGRQTMLSLVPGMTHLRLGDPVQFNLAPERLHFFDRAGKRV
ncbi:MAG TPA: TOBE domain-containing protein, partial [Hyphomicrobiales bacterium]|nr:TOBE domain-containing protein [Hyphomicrobiales bacterium]